MRFIALILCLSFVLSACGSRTPAPGGVKVGNPYQVYGRWYTPEYDPTYEETGTASWYGPGFHGKHTSNGERFDQDDMTAAHRTLPMPSLVRVTNLDNGKSAVVRINDRGPYHSNRIIDLSKAAAKELGVTRTGTAKVRIQYLKEETEAYLEEHNIPGKEKILQAAMPVPKTNKWSLISDANAEEITEEAPSEPIAGHVESQALPPIRPVYKTESNLDAPKPMMKSYQETIPNPKAPSVPFTPPEESVQVPEETSPSLDEAMNKAEVEEPIEDRIAPLTPSKPAYYVQVGAFGARKNAESLMTRLESFNPQLGEAQSAGKTLYRVRIGPYTTGKDAANAVSQLDQMGLHNTRLVKQ